MDLELRLENMEQKLADIKQTDSVKDRNIMSDYEEFINDFHQLVVKAKSVSTLLDKARQHYSNNKEILEMNLLFSAYYNIKASNLSDEDLRAASLTDYTTGNTLTLEGMEQRLLRLGWRR